MGSGTKVLIILGVGGLAAGVAYGLGAGEEALEADYWRRRYESIRDGASRTVAETCGRPNPPERRPRRHRGRA